MRQILSIATTIFKTLWRKRLPLYGIFFLTMLFAALSYFSPEARLSFAGFVSHVKISLFILLGLFLIFSFGSGITLISEAFEDWSIHLIKVRPISGLNYFLGCTLGLALSIITVFLVVLFLSSFILAYNYSQLPNKARSEVSQLYSSSQLSYLSKKVDYEALAKQQLKVEGDALTPDQLFLRSRKLKVADDELLAHAGKSFTFENVSPSSDTRLHLKLKISGDVFGVNRKFSQLKLVFRIPDKEINTFSEVRFESSKAMTLRIPSTAIASDGTVIIQMVNADEQGRTFYFNSLEGPKLIQKESGLIVNGLKALLLALFNIFLFSAGGLLLGLMFSSAVSFFFSFAYFTIASFTDLGLFHEQVTQLIHFVFKSPFGHPFLAMFVGSEFISFNFLFFNLFTLSFNFFILVWIAHFIYSRREMAAVMRTR